MEYYKYCIDSNDFTLVKEPNRSILPQIVWHITHLCNLDCSFCFSKKTVQHFDITKLNDLISKFKLLGIQKVDISGGEPFLHSNLLLICEALDSAQIAFTITTSGYSIALPTLQKILDLSYLSRIIISLDHPLASVHDHIRGVNGVYSQVIDLLNTLKSTINKKVRINTVVTNRLIDHKILDEFILLIATIQPRDWCLIQMHPANKKSHYDDYDITTFEYDNVISYISKKNIFTNVSVLFRPNDLYSEYWILEPENTIYKHTKSIESTFKGNLINDEFNSILYNIDCSQFKVPINKKEQLLCKKRLS